MGTDRTTATFAQLADALVADFDVHELLPVITTKCVDLFGVTAAGLLLADEYGQLRVTASSSDDARLLELFQIQNDEGPCLDCYHGGELVTAERLDRSGTRWPRFAPAAAAEGFASVVALPLRMRGFVVGALTLFGTEDAPPISGRVVALAQAMADLATIAILQDRLARDRGLLSDQLHDTLTSRMVIERAKGVLSTRLHVDMDEAFQILRRRAAGTGDDLVTVAERAVAETARGDAGTGPEGARG